MTNEIKDVVSIINQSWTDIYHLLHYVHEENISHQAIRLLQHIEKSEESSIGDLATYLGITHNTASEHVKRLINKDYVSKVRSTIDERKVIVILNEEGHRVLNKNTRLDTEKLNTVLEKLNESDIDKIEQAFLLLSNEAKQCFS